jgi:high-affinity iron transporter
MLLRSILIRAGLLISGAILLVGRPPVASAQQTPAQRLSSIVGVAVEEYALGVDANGRVISELEYGEAVDFLGDARNVAARLSGDRAEGARVVLDSLIQAVAAKRDPASVSALHQRFMEALGSAGALELPTRPLNTERGRQIYERSCASCHGTEGLGDGPMAVGMDPPPLPIGSAPDMVDATPTLLFRVLSVGIKNTAMTGWADELSVDERWDVVAYLHKLRASDADRLEGEGLFLQRCASCHGVTGSGDGPVAGALTRLPADVGSFVWQVEKSDGQIAEAIREGVPGSAMPPSPDLSAERLSKMVAYVRMLPVKRGDVPALARSDSLDPPQIAQRVRSLLSRAISAAEAGRTDEANDLAFDAYIAFEPLETSARAKSPGLVATLESRFAEFKAAASSGDARHAERMRDAIEAGLPGVIELTQAPAGKWAAFLQSFLIILREGVEAILVVGAVVAFLIRTGNRNRLRSIWIGCAAAIVASAATAVILQTVLRSLPATREIIEGVTMLIAVAVLFSVSYWLISKVEAAKWQQFIKEKVEAALSHGGSRALTFVAFLAVYREGAETALFYQALFHEGAQVMVPIGLGIVVGGLVLAVIFTLFYRFGVRIPLRPFFAVTSVLLYYLAFVFMGKGIRELQEGNAMPITLIPGFPEFPALGIFPTVETVLAQLVLLVLFAIALLKTFWPRRAVTLPTAPTPVPALTERVEALDVRVAELERMTREQQRSTREASIAD